MVAHRFVKSTRVLRVFDGVVKGHLPKLTDDTILSTVSNHIAYVLPQRIVFRSLCKNHHAVESRGMIRAQQLTSVRKRELTICAFSEKLKRTQRSQKPVGKVRIDS